MQAPSWLSKPPARKDEGDSTPSDSSFSAPPPAVKEDPYEKEDYSRYTSRGGSHSEPERRPMFEGGLYHPRLRGCLAQMAMGSKMGAAIGGIFGMLMGGYQAIAQRNLLILPVAAVGGAVSFGFFLGCGMIIRCDDGTYVMMTNSGPRKMEAPMVGSWASIETPAAGSNLHTFDDGRLRPFWRGRRWAKAI